MKIILIGPPYAGKDTQAQLLAEKLHIPEFSMGSLIRQAYEQKNPLAVEGFENYSLKGLHIPIKLKFGLLKEKLDSSKEGFILDNFPATQEDLDTFILYLQEKEYAIDKVFHLYISPEEMMKRRKSRGRGDDSMEIVLARRENQDKDRQPVLEYFKQKGILAKINGEQSIEKVYNNIIQALPL